MAYKNKKILNPSFGQEILFLQTLRDTEGKFLEMQATYFPHSKRPALHYHPFQEEYFEVMEGEMKVITGNDHCRLKKGDRLHIPPNQIHTMWNDTNHHTILLWKVSPALHTEYLLETASGFATDGFITKSGNLPFLLSIFIAHQFSNVFRLAKPPFLVQRLVTSTLFPLFLFYGYKSKLQKYID
ncbi:MAG TPA: cupin domain-containing protein [Saprospiraceae bacterium]|nr:cupin domain-containing protein [Saprospiraceae bacterium]